MKTLRVGELALSPDEDEAKWLRDLMQNPLYDDETPSEARRRKQWFEAMKDYCEALNPPKSPACGTCFRNQTGYDPDEDIPF